MISVKPPLCFPTWRLLIVSVLSALQALPPFMCCWGEKIPSRGLKCLKSNQNSRMSVGSTLWPGKASNKPAEGQIGLKPTQYPASLKWPQRKGSPKERAKGRAWASTLEQLCRPKAKMHTSPQLPLDPDYLGLPTPTHFHYPTQWPPGANKVLHVGWSYWSEK